MNAQSSKAGSSAAEGNSFSATDYLFVSTRVAKAFPDSVESAVILAYRSQVIAQEQSERWTKVQAHRTWQMGFWASSPFTVVGLVASNAILWLGSQPMSVQELLVYAANPALVGGAFVAGSVLSNKPFIAFPVGTAILFIGAVAVYYLKKAAEKRPLALRMAAALRTGSMIGGRRLLGGIRPGQVAPLTTTGHQPDQQHLLNVGQARLPQSNKADSIQSLDAAEEDAVITPVCVQDGVNTLPGKDMSDSGAELVGDVYDDISISDDISYDISSDTLHGVVEQRIYYVDEIVDVNLEDLSLPSALVALMDTDDSDDDASPQWGSLLLSDDLSTATPKRVDFHNRGSDHDESSSEDLSPDNKAAVLRKELRPHIEYG